MGTAVFLPGLPSTPHLLAESSPGAGPATKTAALVDLLRGEGRKPRQWLTEDASSSPLLRIWSNVWQRDSWQRESHGETREDTDTTMAAWRLPPRQEKSGGPEGERRPGRA